MSISHIGLLQISQEMVYWKRLAQRLGLTPAIIVEIRENNRNDFGEQKLQMLQQWKRANGRLATWRALVGAVIEENDYELVDKIVAICKPCSFIVMLTFLLLAQNIILSCTQAHAVLIPETLFVEWQECCIIHKFIIHAAHMRKMSESNGDLSLEE